jgi:hypothetical protein
MRYPTHRKHPWSAAFALALALAFALGLGLAACGSGGGGTSAATTVPPNVVPEPASAWTSITVTAAGGRNAHVPASMFAKASPLLTGRLFDSPEPLSSYGLDSPSATITYTGTGGHTRTVVVGRQNFDGHGYYVQRKGDPRVFLVPADQLDPLLRLVDQTEAPR